MSDRVIFISGGAHGLGLFLAQRCLDDGHRVYCGSRAGEIPEALADLPGDRLRWGRLDVTNYSSCEDSIRDCLQAFGRIDVLVNNASGFFGGHAIGSYSPELLQMEVETTLLGGMFLTNAFAAAANVAERRQQVIFISSISGVARESGNGMYPAYAACKAGVIRFSQTINETLSKDRTSSHVLVPNSIRADRLTEQEAVSFEDVYRGFCFLTDLNDNLYVDQIVLDPFRREGVE